MQTVSPLSFSGERSTSPNPVVEERRRLPVLPVARLLETQKSLTAVERFAKEHEEGQVPLQAKYYKNLIPLSKPGPGEQYSFEVDLDKCTGCKACVSACHTLNGLDDNELWRTVGLLHGGSTVASTQQTVTTSCHHCVDPACMNGCPVNAYEKDPITGIVKHLDDQCFGCQYCTLMCPYDAPKFSAERGIVRKCDMCSDRLAHDEAPACVQACPNEAIAIRIVEQAEAIQTSEAGMFLPGAPTPEHTVPTTVYKTARPLPHNLLPADFYATRPEHPHLPLVGLLTLSQLAVGVILVKGFIEQITGTLAPEAAHQTAAAALLTVVALGVGVFHLGRPLLAWRAVLNVRNSWFSREALVFGVFAALVLTHGALVVGLEYPPLLEALPGSIRESLMLGVPIIQDAAAVTGVLAVLCSVMVYVATKRPQWSGLRTALKFFGTTLVLGVATVLAVTSFGADEFDVDSERVFRTLLEALVVASTVKLAYEGELLRHIQSRQHTIEKRMATVMLRDLRLVTLSRFALGLAGGIVVPLIVNTTPLSSSVAAPLLVCGLALSLAGELAERYLFFRAAPASRMPGGLP